MKLVVRPSGEFSLIDPISRADIKKGRISVVSQTGFVSQRVSLGQLEMLGQLPDEAVEADFLATLKEFEDDVILAIEAYVSELNGPDGAVKVTTQQKPKGKAKPKDESPDQ